MLRLCLFVFSLTITGLAMYGCSSGTSTVGSQGLAVQPGAGAEPGADLPAGLPVDVVQPWERLNADGLVAAAPGRSVTGINADSEFIPGFDTLLAGGDVADHGDSARLTGAAGSLAWAVYRCPLGGAEPGVVSVDANCWAGDGYYVGIADYGRVAWDWHGPFRDNHVRLGTAGSDCTSALGIAYVCVAAWEGTGVDVVGVGINPLDPGDTVAPPAPALLDATPVTGGVELNWLAVTDADVAGYLVCFAPESFNDVDEPGVRRLGYLIGDTSVTIPADGPTWFRVATMDLSGNLSDASLEAMAGPLPGTPPEVVLTTTVTECQRGGEVQLNATGAEAYDWDLDGDGSFDVMGDTTGAAQAVTTGAGLIRPRVRGYSGEPSCRACAAVSLVVSANSRPLAIAHAFPPTGVVPLSVTFEGEAYDYDGEVIGAGWDFDGDGAYDVWDAAALTHLNPPPQSYPTPGLVNVRFRIVDDEGAFDVGTVAINPQPEPENLPPVADFTANRYRGPAPLAVELIATGSHDPDGNIVLYEWDWESDGTFDASGTDPEYPHSFDSPGVYHVGLRVTDNDGATGYTSALFTASGPVHTTVTANSMWTDLSLISVEGNPAIFYVDATSHNLSFIRATDPAGSAWGTPVIAAASIDYFNHHGAGVANGNPCAAYTKSGNVEYVRATDSAGTAFGAPVTVNASGYISETPALEIVDGCPAVAFCYNAVPYGITFSRGDDAGGTAFSSPLTAQSLANAGYRVDLTVVDGHPAIAWIPFDATMIPTYKRADDVHGTAWTTAAVGVGTVNSIELSLAVINGIPAMTWATDDGTNRDIRYVRADDAEGSTWNYNYPRTVLDTGFNCFIVELMELDGRPVVGVMDGIEMSPYYYRAVDPDGLTFNDRLTFDYGGDTGLGLSGMVVEGRAAYAYIDDMRSLVRFTRIVE